MTCKSSSLSPLAMEAWRSQYYAVIGDTFPLGLGEPLPSSLHRGNLRSCNLVYVLSHDPGLCGTSSYDSLPKPTVLKGSCGCGCSLGKKRSECDSAAGVKLNLAGIFTGLVIILLGVLAYIFLLWLRRTREEEAIRHAQAKRDIKRDIKVSAGQPKKKSAFTVLWRRSKVRK
eukprot:1195806-Prorocentrum_minimum.AAC.12